MVCFFVELIIRFNSFESFSYFFTRKHKKALICRYGNWGICFIYGTWFALEGLEAAGKTYHNCLAMRKGVQFLLKTQNEDGGWGESYLSCPNKVNLFFLHKF
jgi:squalene cyclase